MRKLCFEELTSTNLYAKEHLSELEDKTIIFTRHQTGGHGRLNRKWLDLGGDNLYMTIVLKPSVQFKANFANITQYLSVTLCNLLTKYNVIAEIKWPNDVLINGKKIAGILSETVIQGDNFKGLVLGVGVNLNVNEGNLKLVTDREITSLNIEISKSVDLNKFIDELCEMFFEDYDKFLQKGFQLIKTDYTNRVHFLNKQISVKGFNSTVTGIASVFTDNGELILKDNDKELILNIGDIL